MKIIHCADVHLDSPLGTHLDSRRAAARNAELTGSFLDLLHRAAETNVDAVIIAGDLFDGRSQRRTMDLVLDAIASTPRVRYFCLRGNHDRDAFPQEVPENLHLFSDRWQYFDLGDVVIAGVELTGENQEKIYDSLALSEDRCNLVVLHGQVGSGAGCIQLSRLREKHIDYLALGHVHSFAMDRLDSRGIWCYSGCLEGRGFDETGDKGYVAVTAGNTGVQASFCPWGRRKIHDIALDVTGQDSNSAVWKRLRQEALPGSDLVRVRLTGERTGDSDLSAAYLEDLLGGSCYALQVRDETVPALDPGELSLRGEFLRLVRASGYEEADKADILRAGLAALRGGEVEL